jgi:hypothetical protein
LDKTTGILEIALEHLQQVHYISALYISSRSRYKCLRRAGPDFLPPEVLNYSVFASVKNAPPPGAPKCSTRNYIANVKT